MKIVVTGGPTREAIDGIRYVTNISTGRTSLQLCEFFAGQGHQLTYIKGAGLASPAVPVTEVPFTSFADLDAKLKNVLGHGDVDLVIHAAAVGDYSVARVETAGRVYAPGEAGKLDSKSELTVTLRPNFKIIDRIKSYARPSRPVLVGFKLTNTPSLDERLAAVAALEGRADFVIHNDVHEMKDEPSHVFTVYRGTAPLGSCRGKASLGPLIQKVLKEYL